ncbi:S8 family serine peptidase [Kangiella marina]|uniref:Peptidase S8/S53 domain-containing protein n=1 Tax=Kangiella marina TaxID=1079178 RepID=A0ABP8I9Y9_9GAMM
MKISFTKSWLMVVMLAFSFSSNQSKAINSQGFDIETYGQELQPAMSNGKQVLFIELVSKPLSEVKISKKRQSVYLKKLSKERSSFLSAANHAGIKLQVRHTYDVLYNGLSIEISKNDLAKIKTLDMVHATYPVYQVMSGHSPIPSETKQVNRETVTVTELTGVAEAHKAGITGEGVVIAIIDSGIDYNHKAFGGSGFPSEKIVAGYDFADNDADPYDDRYGIAAMHGTHVAGIAAGEDDIMVGVAPDAKLSIYRIFGTENPYTTEDILIAAMEQAVKDGANVVNMSWGSNRAEVIKNGLISRAADRMIKQGVVPVVAIGNTLAGPFLPGSPAIARDAIAVGAAYNDDVTELAFKNSQGELIPFRSMYKAEPVPGDGTYELVNVGEASCNPAPEGVSYEGKIVLVERGHFRCRPYTAINYLADAGAEAAIWWQDSWNPERWASPFSSYNEAIKIPATVIRAKDGKTLSTLQDGISLSWGHYYSQEFIFGGLPAYFSSWGPSHELDLKPDVMAPGGFIFSTLPSYAGGYGLNNGTSMAAPHVAGIAALMLSADPSLKAHDVRRVLMSSALPAQYNSDINLGLHPIAQQGAGMVNASRALASLLKVEPAKISLGDLNGAAKTQRLTVENKSSTDMAYNISYEPALSVAPPMNAFWVPRTASISLSLWKKEILVPAEGQSSFEVSFVDSPELPQGSIVSGWIVLTPKEGDEVRIPYLGLSGDYHQLPALNPTFKEFNQSLDNPSLRPETRPFCSGPPPTQAPCCRDPRPGSCGWSIGPSKELTLDFSNDDKYDDTAFVMLSQGFPMLRKYRARIIDSHGKTVAWAKDRFTGLQSLESFEYWVRNSGVATGIDFAQWDGTLESGELAPAGTYYIRLEFDKLGGDGQSYPDFESWTSPTITVIR